MKNNGLSLFKKQFPQEYADCVRQGLLKRLCDEMGWEYMVFKPKGYWSKERCLEEAIKYDMKEKWKKGHNNSYAAAMRNGWYNELSEHMIDGCAPKNYWTKEKCHIEALHFQSKEKWKKGHTSSYQAARRNKWVEECSSHMPNLFKNKGYWTKERCIKEAKKYKTIKEWNKHATTSVQVSRLKKWLDECISHMILPQKPRGYWSKERCLEEAKKYKTKIEWFNNDSASYQAARVLKCFEECALHMQLLRTPSSYWTKERCIEEAKKYKKISHWQDSAGVGRSSYNAANMNKWLDECTEHMKKNK